MMYQITSLQQNFSLNSRKQAKSIFSNMKKYATNHGQNNIICPFSCNWDTIYSNRFNIANFPCKHTILTSNVEFIDIQIPDDNSEFYHEVIQQKQIQNWLFTENKMKESNMTIDESQNTGLNVYSENSVKEFIFQTAKDIHFVTNGKVPKHEIIYELTTKWLLITSGKSNAEINSFEFKSKFRIDSIKEYMNKQN